MELHPLEKKVLEGLERKDGKGTATEIAEAASIEKIQAERFGYSLSQKNLINIEKTTTITVQLTQLGTDSIRLGLPEKRVLQALEKEALAADQLSKKADVSETEAKATFGILKKNNWVSMDKGDKGLVLKLTSQGESALKKKLPLEDSLVQVEKGESPTQDDVKVLQKRGLVEETSSVEYKLELRSAGKKALASAEDTEQLLTHEMLKTGTWKGIKFRKYDVTSKVDPYYGGKFHPITSAINRFRRVFLEMGFEEGYGPVVESSFWNFDALFQPQDHPARDLADTFYLKQPQQSTLPDAKIVDRVKRAHEEGTADSLGWRYKWSPDISKQPIFRTHTTAVSTRYLNKITPPAKVFCIGRVFRNETADYSHLPEFTQIEGIVADEDVTFKDLLGYLKEFYWKLGFDKVRFRPAYFPYTEMSVEPEVWIESRQTWMELGGAGIFRPEVTKPLGIDVPVLAWGLGLDRILAMKLGLDDIRNFYYRNDVKWLREVPSV